MGFAILDSAGSGAVKNRNTQADGLAGKGLPACITGNALVVEFTWGLRHGAPAGEQG